MPRAPVREVSYATTRPTSRRRVWPGRVRTSNMHADVAQKAAAVERAALKTEQWGRERGWVGPDPYDGGNATRIVTPLHRYRWGRIVVAQTVKRSPVNLRR